MRLNILNKEGFLTDSDRKESLVHGCNYLTFHTNLELSEPIKVTQYGFSKTVTLEHYSQDVASFFVWWTELVMKDLNGFTGFSHVKFELVDFKVI